MHSTVSDGMATVPQIIEYVEYHTDLDIMAIADHDQIDGAYQALRWVEQHPGCRVQVVFGTEITGFLGRHLLAYFFRAPYPQRPFRRFQRLERTIEEVQALGGIVVFPHPTSIWTPSVGYGQICKLIASQAPVHGLEVCNASIGARYSETKLRVFNRQTFKLAELGGSDAHHLLGIGGGVTHFQGATLRELECAIRSKTTQACWGPRAAIPVREHARQVVQALLVKPCREVCAAIMRPTITSSAAGPEQRVPAAPSAGKTSTNQ
jgi:predicted metal-dependent phosphoesterase TrpH